MPRLHDKLINGGKSVHTDVMFKELDLVIADAFGTWFLSR
jgi:hypothetical protein